MFKKAAVLLLLTLTIGCLAFAQSESVYQVNYYANRNNSALADSVVRVINPGVVGTPISPDHGTICADIYVFDSTQEMLECCSCPITANGILELSLLNDLMQNPLTGFPAPDSGVIKIVSDTGANCNELAPVPQPTLLGFASHVQQPIAGTFVTTEDEFQTAYLTPEELGFLGQACSFVQYLGSGKGVCQCGAAS
ncbi:MAG TPA: hypothetical protein VFP40_14745 [Terriglobales bacterium]|nr:hypothetical protein [Terriglobales bacterium]